jgi:hypothetical protein
MPDALYDRDALAWSERQAAHAVYSYLRQSVILPKTVREIGQEIVASQAKLPYHPE